MDIKQYIELSRQLGHTIIQTSNYYWMKGPSGFATHITPLEICPEQSDFNQLFGQGVKFVRFNTRLDVQNAGEWIFCGDNYDLSQFSKSTRKVIKHGLESCKVVDADIDDLIEEGFMINESVLRKQGRCSTMDQEKWTKYITTFFNWPGVIIKGAYVNNRLIAYTIFIKVLDKYYLKTPYMNYDFADAEPIRTILYIFINEVLQREGRIELSYGPVSFGEGEGLRAFKKRMGFEEIGCSTIIIINPYIKNLINKFGMLLLKYANKVSLISNKKINQYKYLMEIKNDECMYFNHLKRPVDFGAENSFK